MLYTSCEPEMVDGEYLNGLLRHYHGALLGHLRDAGREEYAAQYTWELFERHFEVYPVDLPPPDGETLRPVPSDSPISPVLRRTCRLPTWTTCGSS